MLLNQSPNRASWPGIAGLLVTASLSISATAEVVTTFKGADNHALFGVDENIQALLSGNRGSNSGGDQSMQGGDALLGTEGADLMIGALGIDILAGYGGNDVLIGGTEEFNLFNHDRGFGGDGDDVFIWAPGDGTDFFNGGDGDDVLILGLIGEQRDAEGNEAGAPFFGVNRPSAEGSQDFDGIYIHPSSGLPIVDVAGGPGFCDVVDGAGGAEEQAALSELGLDHLVRFSLRGPTTDTTNSDTGLHIAVHLLSTEYLVCGGATAGEIVALDLTTSPPTPIDVSQIPAQAYNLIQ